MGRGHRSRITLDGRVSLGFAALAGTHHESFNDILQELLVHERKGIDLYRQLLSLSEGRSVSLEEFARQKIRNEEIHVKEIEKDASPARRRTGEASIDLVLQVFSSLRFWMPVSMGIGCYSGGRLAPDL